MEEENCTSFVQTKEGKIEYIIIVTINQKRKINKEFYQGKKKDSCKYREKLMDFDLRNI